MLPVTNMISIPALLDLNGKKIVPVRAIPFVTGNVTALGVVQLLADPELNFTAFVLSQAGQSHEMLPKEWGQFIGDLQRSEEPDSRSLRQEKVALLPPSTYVFWDGLWRTYEATYGPDRSDLDGYLQSVLANFQLQEIANMPREFVELVFEGFGHLIPKTSDSVAVTPATVKSQPITPVLRSIAQENAILCQLKNLGFAPDQLPQRHPGRSGVKAKVKAALGTSGMWVSQKVFDKAWERLRSDGRVAEV
jgi:hypothetical protein